MTAVLVAVAIAGTGGALVVIATLLAWVISWE